MILDAFAFIIYTLHATIDSLMLHACIFDMVTQLRCQNHQSAISIKDRSARLNSTPLVLEPRTSIVYNMYICGTIKLFTLVNFHVVLMLDSIY